MTTDDRFPRIGPSPERLQYLDALAEIRRLREALDDALMPHADGCPRVGYDYAFAGSAADCTCGVEVWLAQSRPTGRPRKG